MANFWVILDRQENQSSMTRGNEGENQLPYRSLGSTKMAPQRPRESESKARWSGNIENAKVVLIEASTAAEARLNIQQLFPALAANACVSVEENKFLESAA